MIACFDVNKLNEYLKLFVSLKSKGPYKLILISLKNSDSLLSHCEFKQSTLFLGYTLTVSLKLKGFWKDEQIFTWAFLVLLQLSNF